MSEPASANGADQSTLDAAADESEAVACLAAVYTFIGSDAAAVPESESAVSTRSGWRAASYLEGGRRAGRIVAPLPGQIVSGLWKAATRALPALLSGCLALATQACPLPAGAAAERVGLAGERSVLAGDPGESTSTRTPSPRLIRVALALGVDRVRIGTPDGAQLRDIESGEPLANLPPSTAWYVSSAPSRLALLESTGQPKAEILSRDGTDGPYRRVRFTPGAGLPAAGHSPTAGSTTGFTERLSLRPERGYILMPSVSDGLFSLSGRLYRGALLVAPAASGSKQVNLINLVNLLDIEDYLLSVVPSEMPAGWPAEALKAQAVAARSYAVANLGKHEADGYDVKATVEDQVYAGVSTESEASNRAVAETDGIVVWHEGKVATTFFHSTSGGSTELGEHVWGRAIPYLRAVADFDDDSPHFSWSRNIGVDRLEEALGRDGKGPGQVLGIFVLSRAPSMRVKEVLVAGSQTARIVSSDTLRRLFALPSTNFNVAFADNSYVFEGRGFGHGLGLSQWGAKKLAEHGYNAAQILTYYYRDVSLERL